jgi:hypothetical protein
MANWRARTRSEEGLESAHLGDRPRTAPPHEVCVVRTVDRMSETFNFSDFKASADAYFVEALNSLDSLAQRATRVAGGDEGELDGEAAGKVSSIAEMAQRATDYVATILHNELRAMT